VIEILRLMGTYELVGLLDPKPELWNTRVLGTPVLGDDAMLPDLYRQGVHHAFIGLGSTGDTGPRRRLYEKARREGFQSVGAIHSQAVISPSAQMGKGLTVMAGAVINAAAILGDNVIVNTGAIVEHDCVLADHVHIATGSRLCSTVRVGIGAHIGAGATVRQSITIGEGAIVAAGAAVVKDVDPWTVVAGVPARVLERRAVDMSNPSGLRPSGRGLDSMSQKAIS
jgi:UDP-perosamine 4-acetyltransferase